MTTALLYGPSFSYFTRAMRILFQFKGIGHELTNAPFGEEIPYFSEAHSRLHPFRKLPVLIEGDLILPETHAIALYLDAKPGPSFLPSEQPERSQALALAHSISTDVHTDFMKQLCLEFRFPKGPEKGIRFDVIDAHLDDAKRTMTWLNTLLSEQSTNANGGLFLLNQQFSLADAYMIPMLDYISQLPAPYTLVNSFEAVNDYLHFQRQQSYCEGILGKG